MTVNMTALFREPNRCLDKEKHMASAFDRDQQRNKEKTITILTAIIMTIIAPIIKESFNKQKYCRH